MKTNTLYKRTFNQCLDVLARASPGSALASEPVLAAELGVSRTTLRAVLAELANSGIVALDGRSKVLLRLPQTEDYLAGADLGSLAEMVERKFMSWMVGPDCSPGQSVNALDLARQFGVSTTAIRDCLNTFSHFGLLERQSNGRWRALGLTVDFVAELFDMREFMEFRAVERFVALPRDHAAWRALAQLEQEHREMLSDIDRRYRDFSDLDHRFHRLINGVVPNRFFANIQGVMSVIFHYHYQWNKKDERERNHVAVKEHLAYVAALQSGNLEQARRACGLHLKTARSTLLASIEVASD
ncbi:GntR family transcriptional regulator (plasmid) [Rhizobium sp. CB3090]|uniref:GntR family transcriptional regulator n=1 Tax=Rhizobium sp. CB3090 TaxID=3039156 RepID=UPI0024B1398E|nr:GntR family transcriptional regulator [Rhizobium sp. CB3090]WFU11616.1 GntR family transcriptional regulator [Rhizobium sp. CB3090]